jgi:23S rRNA (guanine2535-N1)-methyltransferase
MQYKYATENQDYSDFSSGRVFYSLPGYPAFPVRLASEIFQRCMASREKIYADSSPCTLYDPCCGAAYQLSVLGFLHADRLREIIASDIDEKAVRLAKQNLGLLTITGLDKRIAEIASLLEQHGKDSHKQALASAHILKNKIHVGGREHPLMARAFQASAFDSQVPGKNIKPASVDIVFTDVPYGQHSRWQGSTPDEFSNPPWSVLDALIGILSPSSIVAIVSDKQQKVSHQSFQRLEHFQVGKRRVVLLKPV